MIFQIVDVFPLEMVIFHSYVSLPEGSFLGSDMENPYYRWLTYEHIFFLHSDRQLLFSENHYFW